MNEKDIQKAKELADERYCIGLSCEQCGYKTALEMAKYKNEQIKNLVKSLNYEYFNSFSEVEDFIINTICGTDTP